jgi:hypothetical protein
VCDSARCSKIVSAPGIHNALLLRQAANEEFPFVDEFFWKMIVQVDEELLMTDNFAAPGGPVQALELLEFLLRENSSPSQLMSSSRGCQPMAASLPSALDALLLGDFGYFDRPFLTPALRDRQS